MTDWAEQAAAMAVRATATDRQEFGSFFLLRLLGMAVSYGEARCTVQFTAGPPLCNPQGTLHGGVLATAMDISMGHLLHHVAGGGTTLEMKVQYMGAVTAGLVRCQASFLRQGRSICFLQSHATGPEGEALAHATATWRLRASPALPPPVVPRGKDPASDSVW